MDKESIIELEKIDCNCNDCVFMVRNIDKFKESEKIHYDWQLDHFEKHKARISLDIDKKYRANDLVAGFALEQEWIKMKFQFNRKECSINFGECSKLNKPISFIPGVLQFETQSCFIHRRAGGI